MRLSLVTWQTAPDPTTWAAPGRHVARGDDILHGVNSGSGPPRESVGPLDTQPEPPGRVLDLREYRLDPRDGSRTSLCGAQVTHNKVPGF